MSTIDQKVVENLKKRLEVTQICRFNYSERLRKKNNQLQQIIIFYSLLAAFISLISIAQLFKEKNTEIVFGAASFFFAMITTTISSLLASGKYLERASKALNCGNSIGRLIHKLEQYNNHNIYNLPVPNYNEITTSYSNILDESENHEDVDKIKVDLDNRKKQIRKLLEKNTFFSKEVIFCIFLYIKDSIKIICMFRPFYLICLIPGVIVLTYAVNAILS